MAMNVSKLCITPAEAHDDSGAAITVATQGTVNVIKYELTILHTKTGNWSWP